MQTVLVFGSGIAGLSAANAVTRSLWSKVFRFQVDLQEVNGARKTKVCRRSTRGEDSDPGTTTRLTS